MPSPHAALVMEHGALIVLRSGTRVEKRLVCATRADSDRRPKIARVPISKKQLSRNGIEVDCRICLIFPLSHLLSFATTIVGRWKAGKKNTGSINSVGQSVVLMKRKSPVRAWHGAAL